MTAPLVHTPINVDQIEEVYQIARSKLITHWDMVVIEYNATLWQLRELEQAGITQATPYYRNGTYLYLIHPTQPDGSRQRDYIGSDPTKQADALASIKRFEEHQTLTNRARILADRLESIVHTLQNL